MFEENKMALVRSAHGSGFILKPSAGISEEDNPTLYPTSKLFDNCFDNLFVKGKTSFGVLYNIRDTYYDGQQVDPANEEAIKKEIIGALNTTNTEIQHRFFEALAGCNGIADLTTDLFDRDGLSSVHRIEIIKDPDGSFRIKLRTQFLAKASIENYQHLLGTVEWTFTFIPNKGVRLAEINCSNERIATFILEESVNKDLLEGRSSYYADIPTSRKLTPEKALAGSKNSEIKLLQKTKWCYDNYSYDLCFMENLSKGKPEKNQFYVMVKNNQLIYRVHTSDREEIITKEELISAAVGRKIVDKIFIDFTAVPGQPQRLDLRDYPHKAALLKIPAQRGHIKPDMTIVCASLFGDLKRGVLFLGENFVDSPEYENMSKAKEITKETEYLALYTFIERKFKEHYAFNKDAGNIENFPSFFEKLIMAYSQYMVNHIHAVISKPILDAYDPKEHRDIYLRKKELSNLFFDDKNQLKLEILLEFWLVDTGGKRNWDDPDHGAHSLGIPGKTFALLTLGDNNHFYLESIQPSNAFQEELVMGTLLSSLPTASDQRERVLSEKIEAAEKEEIATKSMGGQALQSSLKPDDLLKKVKEQLATSGRTTHSPSLFDAIEQTEESSSVTASTDSSASPAAPEFAPKLNPPSDELDEDVDYGGGGEPPSSTLEPPTSPVFSDELPETPREQGIAKDSIEPPLLQVKIERTILQSIANWMKDHPIASAFIIGLLAVGVAASIGFSIVTFGAGTPVAAGLAGALQTAIGFIGISVLTAAVQASTVAAVGIASGLIAGLFTAVVGAVKVGTLVGNLFAKSSELTTIKIKKPGSDTSDIQAGLGITPRQDPATKEQQGTPRPSAPSAKSVPEKNEAIAKLRKVFNFDKHAKIDRNLLEKNDLIVQFINAMIEETAFSSEDAFINQIREMLNPKKVEPISDSQLNYFENLIATQFLAKMAELEKNPESSLGEVKKYIERCKKLLGDLKTYTLMREIKGEWASNGTSTAEQVWVEPSIEPIENSISHKDRGIDKAFGKVEAKINDLQAPTSRPRK